MSPLQYKPHAQRKVDDAKRAYLEASENDSDELEKAMEEAQTALDEAKSNLEEKKDEEQRLLAIVKRRKEKLTRRQNWQKVNERAAKMNQTADFQSYKVYGKLARKKKRKTTMLLKRVKMKPETKQMRQSRLQTQRTISK